MSLEDELLALIAGRIAGHERSMQVEIGDERLPARFWAKVRILPSDCWEWTGSTHHEKGYAAFRWQGRTVGAHRLAYAFLVGDIPEGFVLDHECHDPQTCLLDNKCPHRRCVNPAHTALVTAGRNSSAERRANRNRLKTHCDQGHPLSNDNLYLPPGRLHRTCRTCAREHGRKFDAEHRAERAAAARARRAAKKVSA